MASRLVLWLRESEHYDNVLVKDKGELVAFDWKPKEKLENEEASGIIETTRDVGGGRKRRKD